MVIKSTPAKPMMNNNMGGEPKKMSKFLKVIIGIGIFIVVVVVIALWATSGMTKAIDKQLAALRAGDLNTAYSLTSKSFQSQTSLEQFREFVSQYPSLSNNQSSTFTNRTNENGLGTVEGKLIAKDGSVTPVAYQLIKEEGSGEWKIQGIKINPGGAQSQNPPSQQANPQVDVIAMIKASDSVGADSVVSTSKALFGTTTPKLSVSVYVSNAKKGDQVAIKLVYTDTGEESDPVTNEISEDGDIVSNFSFSKPTTNWAVGNYKIMAATTSGSQQEVPFQVK